jgi:hypothetical protein
MEWQEMMRDNMKQQFDKMNAIELANRETSNKLTHSMQAMEDAMKAVAQRL